jgi:16S rRNA (guanine(966)-N(2))-methyltransferase RsmD
MRVIAGACKGRRLSAPRWAGLRPTSDKLRETLFNVVGARVRGVRVIDAYAGTGAIGIEALSRGASHVTFIERDGRAAALIQENVARCGFADACAIIRADVRAAARQLSEIGPFELILLDPPYDTSDATDALAFLGIHLAPGGLVVLEHASRRAAPDAAGALVRFRDLVSGDSALAFYRVASPPPSRARAGG